MEIKFGAVELLLYDEYLIVKDTKEDLFTREKKERKILKEDITSFVVNRVEFTTTNYGGRVGGSVRVAKGVYINTSSPYYNKKTNVKFSPYILLTSREKIYLGDVFQFDSDFPFLTQKIAKCNDWREYSSLFELEQKLAREREANIKMQSIELPLFWIWFVIFIISIFTLGSTTVLFMFSVMSITYYFLIAWAISLIKEKRTGLGIGVIIFVILSFIGLVGN